MKKKIFMIILIVIILAVAEAVILWWIAPKAFLKNQTTEDIQSIKVFDGSTGKQFEITDSESIARIVSSIQGVKFKKSGISENYEGFSFSMTFFDNSGKEIDSFIVNSDSQIRKDPFFYETEGNMNIFDFLKELENNI